MRLWHGCLPGGPMQGPRTMMRLVKTLLRGVLPGKTLVRYVLWELTWWFLFALAGLTSLITLVLVVQKALLSGLGLSQIVALLPYGALASLRFSVPGTVLFATCLVFGRLSAHNELTAIKSLGISPMAVLAPVYVFAFLLSLLMVWLNDLAASWGELQMRRVVISSLEGIVYGMLEAGGAYRAPRFSIVVQGVRGRTLIHPTIKYVGPDGKEITVSAETAELRGNPAENTMKVLCRNTGVEVSEFLLTDPRESSIEIPLPDLSRKDQPDVRISNLAMWEIPRRLARTDQEIAETRQTMAASVVLGLATGDLELVAGETWSTAKSRLADLTSRRARLVSEPHRRWANGFSCLAFVVVGAAAAIRLRNADVISSFFACFLPILLIYYPLLLYGSDQAKGGNFPPSIVWLGNVVLLAVGTWLHRWVMRY